MLIIYCIVRPLFCWIFQRSEKFHAEDFHFHLDSTFSDWCYWKAWCYQSTATELLRAGSQLPQCWPRGSTTSKSLYLKFKTKYAKAPIKTNHPLPKYPQKPQNATSVKRRIDLQVAVILL